MEEKNVVEQFSEAAKEAGMTVIDMPPMPTAKGMNGWVVAGAAGTGLVIGGLLVWGGSKLVKAFFKPKKAKTESEDNSKADTADDEE